MGLAALGQSDEGVTQVLRDLVRIENGRPMAGSAEALEMARQAVAPFERARGDGDVEKAADLTASAQAAFADLADQMLEVALAGSIGNLLLSGGCALNSAYNGIVRRRFGLQAVHVPSAPADDGTAIRAAIAAWLEDHPDRELPQCRTPFLGSAVRPSAVDALARNLAGCEIERTGDVSARRVADLLAAGKIAGVMRGRAEFGPRALGNRSILADSTRADMQGHDQCAGKGVRGLSSLCSDHSRRGR